MVDINKDKAIAMGAYCQDCPLKDQPIVYGRGPDNTDIVITGEAPDTKAVKTGVPFIGPSGQLLDKILLNNNIRREDVYVTNAVLCKTPGIRPPTANEVKHCRDRLAEEIKAKAPQAVLGLGAIASKALLGTKTKMSAIGLNTLRIGGAKPSELLDGIPVVATFHPSAALRSPDRFPSIVADVAKLTRPNIAVGWEPTKVTIADDVEYAIRRLSGQVNTDLASIDLETAPPFDRRAPEILCLGVSDQPGSAIVYTKRVVDDRRFLDALNQAFLDTKWIMQNGKYDVQYLWGAGVPNARLDEDTLLMHYCHVPGTKILKRDLTWENIENLKVGDELIGTESKPSQEKYGYPSSILAPTEVLKTSTLEIECYAVETERKTMIVSGDHLWPVNRAGSNTLKWIRTDELMLRMSGVKGGKPAQYRLPFYVEPWETDNTYEGGYIAGILDGEGTLGKHQGLKGATYTLTFAQKPGAVLDQTLKYLRDKGVGVNEYTIRPESGVVVCGVKGIMRALGMFRPARFMQDTDRYWMGPRKTTPTPILSVKPVGVREVLCIETTLHTFIADGFLSHNSTDERKGTHDLEQLATEFINAPNYKTQAKMGLVDDANIVDLPKETLYEYNATDADVTLRLFEPLRHDQINDGVLDMYYNLLIPGSEALARVEYAGIAVDQEQLEVLDLELVSQMKEMEEKLTKYVNNPRSPMQIKRAFDEMFDENFEKTNEDTLTRFIEKNPISEAADFARSILKYRNVQKEWSTYVRGMVKHIHNGRIHSSFLLHGTETGRLSSRSPNMQNIKVGRLRSMFQASEGRQLVSADYQAIELRVAASILGDDWLLEQFRLGRQIHKEVARALFGDSYSDRQYTDGKAVTFGIFYDRRAPAIAGQLRIPVRKAQRMIDNWKANVPGLELYWERIRNEIKEKSYLTSAYGRKRRFWLITMDNMLDVFREGYNFPISASASDITLRSLIRLEKKYRDTDGVDPVITVHDSLTFDVAEQYVNDVKLEIERVMMDTPDWDVPTPVDFKVGVKWS